ncbi:MAG: hypothetical protein PHD76_08050 [Methylacidiphilales bacterium]|nr:hypothetical protein [Candidatus Methylacidiphilales bacterium]
MNPASALRRVPVKKTALRRKKRPQFPLATDWRTTDAHEILKRQLRAAEERPRASAGVGIFQGCFLNDVADCRRGSRSDPIHLRQF